MTDATDGSSSAAQSAQSLTQDPAAPPKAHRFLRRLFQALSPAETTPDADAGPQVEIERRDMLPGLSNLQNLRVEDVAVPRAEIVAVEAGTKRDDLLDVFRDSGLSRLPVYTGTLDTPLGLVHIKDFALEHGFNSKGPAFSLRKLVRPLLYVPPSMPIGVLLQKMQTDRIHMALVIDEYGGVDGLVTLEDLIEQVLGEIEDEHDIDEDKFWVVEHDGVWLAEARTPLDDFEAESGLALRIPDEEEIDTLGGVVFLLLGRVPARGEVIVHPSGAEFEVVDADPRRIKRLRVCRPDARKPTT
jgi:magnesium and cobalt transporter